jgi:uncharacterized protein YjbI with pentapeptide repeats
MSYRSDGDWPRRGSSSRPVLATLLVTLSSAAVLIPWLVDTALYRVGIAVRILTIVIALLVVGFLVDLFIRRSRARKRRGITRSIRRGSSRFLAYDARISSDERESLVSLTRTFSEAVANLGRENAAERLGGVYTLEQIARFSETDGRSVFEILIEHLKSRASLATERDDAAAELAKPEIASKAANRQLDPDIQAAVAVVVRLANHLRLRLDLSDLDLQDLKLPDASLIGVDFSGTNLARADLSLSDLSRGNLQAANLREADLTSARLEGAFIEGANLTGANLANGNLTSALLTRVSLNGAVLVGASLQDAVLSNVQLRNATLVGADLTNAYLEAVDSDTATRWPEGFDFSIAKELPNPNTQGGLRG